MSKWARALLRYLRLQRHLILHVHPARTAGLADTESNNALAETYGLADPDIHEQIADLLDRWEGRWMARYLTRQPYRVTQNRWD